jgi:heme iron utilization protein
MEYDKDKVALRELLASRKTAALGTLHSGAPYVSMVPFTLLPDGTAFIIHVSQLAPHTKDMLADPHVSLLITGTEKADGSPLDLPRVTILGTAQKIPVDSAGYPFAREAYLGRIPDAAPLFSLGDFSLFRITPTEARWIGGFAQARSISPVNFALAVKGISD